MAGWPALAATEPGEMDQAPAERPRAKAGQSRHPAAITLPAAALPTSPVPASLVQPANAVSAPAIVTRPAPLAARRPAAQYGHA